MKNILITLTLLLLSIRIIAQIGIGTTNPDSASALDVVSTNQGLLPPRVANVTAIDTPVAGLMIYDLSNQCMRYYNGTIWSDCLGGITAVSPCGTATTMTDIDGNIYPIVAINNKCWMAADLKVSRYPNGDAIPYIDNNATWAALAGNNTDDAYGFYGDSNSNGTVDIIHPDYGALYTYSAAIGDNWVRDNSAINSEGGQGICPDGWHLPTTAEWTALTTFLGGVSVAGGKMKETGTTHWNNPNADATNSSGFTALPSGYRGSTNGAYLNIGYFIYWWAATEYNSSNAYYRFLSHNNALVSYYRYNKSIGFSVRCIRD